MQQTQIPTSAGAAYLSLHWLVWCVLFFLSRKDVFIISAWNQITCDFFCVKENFCFLTSHELPPEKGGETQTLRKIPCMPLLPTVCVAGWNNSETRRAQNSVSSKTAKNSITSKKKPQAPQRLVWQKPPYQPDTDNWVKRVRERALSVVKSSLIKQCFKAFQQILMIANVEKVYFWHSLIMVTGRIIPLPNVINVGQGLPCAFVSMACINPTEVTSISAFANARIHNSPRCWHGFPGSSEAAGLERSALPTQPGELLRCRMLGIPSPSS